MDIDLEDGPSFVKQRRNVMIICLVVFAASFLGLDYSKATLFGVTPSHDAAARLPILFAFFIWYFVWRLSQCDIPPDLLQWPQAFAYAYLQEHLPSPDDYLKAEAEVQDAYQREVKEKVASQKRFAVSHIPKRSEEELQIKSVESAQVTKLVLNTGHPATYVLEFTLALNYEHGRETKAIAMKLLTSDSLYRWAWYRGYVLACFRKLYFTEYVLPYLMGFTVIWYCVVSYALSNH